MPSSISMQRTHYNSEFRKKKLPIYLICDNIQSGLNLGGILRAADAFGIQEVLICGDRKELEKQVLRTSRSTEKYVPYSFHENTFDVIRNFSERSVSLLALEISTKSIEISKFKSPENKVIGLVIGSENFGISPKVLEAIKEHVHINMYGENSSMNVVQATSIALYQLSKLFI